MTYTIQIQNEPEGTGFLDALKKFVAQWQEAKTDAQIDVRIETVTDEKLTATKALFTELKKGEDSAVGNGWIDADDVRKIVGL